MNILSIIIPIVVLIAVIVFLMLIYKVADVDKALIITGGKEPIIKVSGGAFVIPIFRKASYFDLCIMTVTADADEIKTSTAVPVVCDWTAQIRPCVANSEKLRIAIISFKERGNQGIINDVKLTLMGAVRDVVATMTPEEILKNKEEFKKKIQTSVSDELDNMGLELVSLNIQDITDRNDYFNNIAAIDASEKRQAADIKKAEVDRNTRQKQATAKMEAEIAEAQAKQEAEIARMTAEQTEKEKRKETDMKLAQFKMETDTANADAEIAKELQETIRQKELEERKGAVEITRQEQANLAAQKEREVMITRAESEKETKRVEAEAVANVRSIEADSKIQVAEREANAARKAAQGEADVETTKAEARVKVAASDAEAVKNKHYITMSHATNERTKIQGAIGNKIYEKNSKFKNPGGIVSSEVELETIPAQLPSENTPADMRGKFLFISGTEPSDVSTRYSKLQDPTNLSYSVVGNQLNLSWTSIPTPDAIDTNYLTDYFNNGYGEWASDYLAKRLAYNNSKIGTVGYEIYLTNGSDSSYVGFTENSNYSIDLSTISGTYDGVIVKSAYTIFKGNSSSGTKVSFTIGNITSGIDESKVSVTMNSLNTSLKVGSTYNKLTSSNIDTIKYDGLDIKNEVVALNVQIADITKDGAPLSAELISSSAGTATVKYKVTFSYKNTNITKTFTQTVNVTN